MDTFILCKSLQQLFYIHSSRFKGVNLKIGIAPAQFSGIVSNIPANVYRQDGWILQKAIQDIHFLFYRCSTVSFALSKSRYFLKITC